MANNNCEEIFKIVGEFRWEDGLELLCAEFKFEDITKEQLVKFYEYVYNNLPAGCGIKTNYDEQMSYDDYKVGKRKEDFKVDVTRDGDALNVDIQMKG